MLQFSRKLHNIDPWGRMVIDILVNIFIVNVSAKHHICQTVDFLQRQKNAVNFLWANFSLQRSQCSPHYLCDQEEMHHDFCVRKKSQNMHPRRSVHFNVSRIASHSI